MLRKTTWSMLLLLLVSIQAFASGCDVRCATMTTVNSTGHMASMAHCQGMESEPIAGHAAVNTLTLSQPCTSHICKNDWAFQSRAVQELGLSSLPAAALSVATAPTRIVISVRWKTDRSMHGIRLFDPLLSSLRV